MSLHTTTTTGSSATRRQKKIVVIMGPTGCGKSKLSVDLASTFFPSSEIINSDKIQVYRGLDITTNKIPLPDRKNVPHHFLGDVDAAEFTPSHFRTSVSSLISEMVSRRALPFIVGGSNSFIYALLAKRFDPHCDVFKSESGFCKETRYKCCFIWVDVFLPVLNEYLEKRVDEMMECGMLEELREYMDSDLASKCRGLNKAIGVGELEGYLKRKVWASEEEQKSAYEKAVREIKENTCQLAKRQLGKILRLREEAGWDIKRVDGTASLRAAMEQRNGERTTDIWEREVVEPSVKIVKQFLME